MIQYDDLTRLNIDTKLPVLSSRCMM